MESKEELKTLGRLEQEEVKNTHKTYKEALLLGSKIVHPKVFVPPLKGVMRSKSVFFTGFQVDTKAVDLWMFFKNFIKVKDIILPRKRDKYNKRFGFVITYSFEEAEGLIKTCNGNKLRNNNVYLSFARNKVKTRTQSNISDIHGKVASNIASSEEKIHELKSDSGSAKTDRLEKRQTTPASGEKSTPRKQFPEFLPKAIRESLAKKQSPTNFPGLEKIPSLGMDDAFLKELNRCLVVETINLGTMASVELMIIGLGFNNVPGRRRVQHWLA